MSDRVLDAIVVGAGHAGLAVSQRLKTAEVEHVVLERGEVGETWRTQRWDSFRLNTPNTINRLPGSAYDGPAPDGFGSTAEWLRRLELYVRWFDLPVRTHTEVSSLTADGSGSFKLTTSDGTLRARNVVVASGGATVAKIPAVARDIDRSIRILTTATYRRPDQLVPGAVLVVGGAQSAVQIAEDLVDSGRDVYLAASKVGRLPRRLRGRDTAVWLREIGWFAHRPQDLPDPAMIRWPNPQVSGTGPRGHTVSYQWLAGRGVTLLGRFEGATGTRLRFSEDLPEIIATADKRAAMLQKGVDDEITKRGIDAPPTDPDPANEPVADLSGYRSPTEIDLRERGIATVIFSTGFTGDFGWLRVPAVDGSGAPVHTEGRSPVEGIWFTGLHWLRTRGSMTVVQAEDDSAHIVGQVVARLRGKVAPA